MTKMKKKQQAARSRRALRWAAMAAAGERAPIIYGGLYAYFIFIKTKQVGTRMDILT
jgi:hypothetical protein